MEGTPSQFHDCSVISRPVYWSINSSFRLNLKSISRTFTTLDEIHEYCDEWDPIKQLLVNCRIHRSYLNNGHMTTTPLLYFVANKWGKSEDNSEGSGV